MAPSERQGADLDAVSRRDALERRGNVAPRESQRRYRPEDQARQSARQKRDRQNGQINGDPRGKGRLGGGQVRGKHAQDCCCEASAESAAYKRQYDTFGQQQPDDA